MNRSHSGLNLYCGIGQEPKVQSIVSSQISFDFCGKVTWTWVAEFMPVTQHYTL